MPTLDMVWEQAAVVAVLLVVLWAGHKGWWYWSPGVRALTTELRQQRDDWRILAVTLMRKQGIDVPAGFETPKLPPPMDSRELPRNGREV